MYRLLYKNKKEIFACIKPNMRMMLFVIVLELFSSVGSAAFPLLNMKLVNLFVYKKLGHTHLNYVILYMISLLGISLFCYALNVEKRKLEMNIKETIQERIIVYSFNKSKEELTTNEIGEIDANLKMDSTSFSQYLISAIFGFPFAFFRLLMVGGLLIYQSYEVAVLVLFTQIIIQLWRKRMYAHIDKQSICVRDSYSELNEVQSDIVGKIPYISAINAGNYLIERFGHSYDKYFISSVKHTRLTSKTGVFSEFLSETCFIFVLVIGSYKIASGAYQVGVLLSIIQYVNEVIKSYSALNKYVVDVHSENKSICNILKILKMDHSDFISEESDTSECVKKIKLSDISFSYNQKEMILSNLSAIFEKGVVNCVLGPSGSGKTTLLRLILADYQPNKGNIYCVTDNGTNKLERNKISFVPQDNVFFTDTVYNNLVLGNDISVETVEKICKECSIYDEILSLEHGFDTMMSNGMNNFSGGQIKRLSIARAILQNKNILLLDEPTSGLDAINAEKVMDCIEKYSKSKVTLLITHDKIAEKRCGQVFHLVDGALV